MRHVVLLLLGSSSLAPAAHAAHTGPDVSLSFFGETLLHPGARAGADFALAESGRHRLTAGAHLATYLHGGNHTGLLLEAEAGYRYTFDNGFFLEARLGLGYLRTFLDGDVYERGSDGRFRTVSLAGQNGFAPTQALGLGYDLSRRSGPPLAAFFRLGAFEQLPFNDGWNLHLTSQLGLSWRFGQGG